MLSAVWRGVLAWRATTATDPLLQLSSAPVFVFIFGAECQLILFVVVRESRHRFLRTATGPGLQGPHRADRLRQRAR